MGFSPTLGGLQGDGLSLCLLLGKYPKKGCPPHQVTLSSLKINVMVELFVLSPLTLSTERQVWVCLKQDSQGLIPKECRPEVTAVGAFQGFLRPFLSLQGHVSFSIFAMLLLEAMTLVSSVTEEMQKQ